MSDAVMSLSTLSALPVFPFADEFPYISDEETLDLAQDIEANGLVHPLVIWNEQLLDGRNRLRALAKTQVTQVPVEYFDGTELEAANHVKALNILRRHLNDAQRMVLAMGLLPYEERDAKRRQGERTDLTTSAQVCAEVSKPNRSDERVAKDFGLSGRSLSTGKALFVADDRDADGVATKYVAKDAAAAAVIDMIKSGEITSVSGAVNEAEKRRAALAGRDESVENRKNGVNPASAALTRFHDRTFELFGDLDAALPNLSVDALSAARHQVERIAARCAETLAAIELFSR